MERISPSLHSVQRGRRESCDGKAARFGPGSPTPVVEVSLSVPPPDCLERHNEEMISPVLVEPSHEHPEQPITVPDSGSLRGARENNDLLLEGDVLSNQMRLSRGKCHDEVQEMPNVLHLRRVPQH